ncbi:MAG TPA: rod shape-determining protein MreC [Thermodesulfovibrionales bacterium]|nr:rod shape-determining protein MreC [Thermodesulfovibrionales bacterium]
MPKKRLLLFLFIIILSLGLMTYQSKKEHLLPLGFLNNTLNGFHAIVNSVKDSITSPFKKMLIREEENTRLKAEIKRLHEEQQQYQEALLENRRLRELLSLKGKEHGYVTAARIIARGADQWSNTFVLDKGLSDGVTKDMTAITPKGLMGKIAGVSNSYSYLLLLTDLNFSAAVRLQESRREGIISGIGLRKCQLKYIPYEEEVKVGDIVITSGLDSLFPQGIPVGYVSKVDKKGTGLFQNIEVTPFEDNSKTEEIAIIKR